MSNTQRSLRKIHQLSFPGYFSIPSLLRLPFEWIIFSPSLKVQLVSVCSVTAEILLTAKHQKQGKKPTLLSQVHFYIWQAKQPRLQVLMVHSPAYRGPSQEPPENQTPPEVLEGRTGRRCEFLHSPSPSHTTYTDSVLKPARSFLRYTPCSSPWFFFSRISVFCCWLGLAVEVLNNRSGSSPVADSDMRAHAHQILLLHSRFRYPKKFRCLSKLNFLRVNYP